MDINNRQNGRIRMIFEVTPELHQRARMVAAEKCVTLKDYLTKALLKQLEEDKKKEEGVV